MKDKYINEAKSILMAMEVNMKYEGEEKKNNMKKRLTSETMGYKPVREWAKILGITPSGINKRFQRNPGMTIDDILQGETKEKIVSANQRRQAVFVYHGQERYINDICSECGISAETFRTRVRNSPNPDEILDAYKTNPTWRRKNRKKTWRKDDMISWDDREYTIEKFCRLCKVELDTYTAACKDPKNPTLEELRTIYRTHKVKVDAQWCSEKTAARKLGITTEQLRDRISAQQSREFRTRPKSVRTIYYDGREWTIPELMELTGMKKSTLLGRIKRGWSIERVVTQKVATKDTYPAITIDGVTKPLIRWCEDFGIKNGTVYARIHTSKMDPKAALLFEGQRRRA